MTTTDEEKATPGSLLKRLAIGAVIAVAGVLAVVGMTPKPMSMDLSQVGTGMPSIVLGYENYSPMGGDALERLKLVRPDYESRLQFVVADLGTPAGKAFSDRYGLRDGGAILVSGNGEPVVRIKVMQPVDALREKLDAVLATLP